MTAAPVDTLLMNAGAGETRIAWVADGRLEDFQVERGSEAVLTGNIYLGRVTKVMAALEAAFVEIGEARPGFLGLSEARHLAGRPDSGIAAKISDFVREGEAVLVEVIGEGQGDKGPRLGAKISLSPALEARRKMARAPSLLERAPSLAERVLRDLPGDVARIAIDDARAAQAARDYCRRHRPELESRIELTRDGFGDALEEEIARLSAPRVALGNGGWIAIQATEGFTAIDVNSGGFQAAGGRGQTSLAVNLQAAVEIGRQIRLRGLGGLILADFIQMADGPSVAAVQAALIESLGRDVPCDVCLSATGFAVITRKRVRTPLSRFWESCSCCGGAGTRPAPESVALALLRAAEHSARAAPGHGIVAHAAPEVTAWLKDWLAAHGDELARRGMARLRLENRTGPREAFDVSTG